jgi:hypothetical protein
MRDLSETRRALAHLARVRSATQGDDVGIDPERATLGFAAIDFVGIDFSTSIQRVASHVIRGWNRFCEEIESLRHDHGVWAFGVNAIPFPFTHKPVQPWFLPRFDENHFQPRGVGRGVIEYGSAFNDYLLLALAYAQELGCFDDGKRPALPVTVSLLCDGLPNGGFCRASDVQPLLEEARGHGVRFRIVLFALREYREPIRDFRMALGLTREELEVAWYDYGTPDERTIDTGFGLLTTF